MMMCDTCALACDERKGWEVLHKCGATGELRPYRVKNCSNYERNKRNHNDSLISLIDYGKIH